MTALVEESKDSPPQPKATGMLSVAFFIRKKLNFYIMTAPKANPHYYFTDEERETVKRLYLIQFFSVGLLRFASNNKKFIGWSWLICFAWLCLKLPIFGFHSIDWLPVFWLIGSGFIIGADHILIGRNRTRAARTARNQFGIMVGETDVTIICRDVLDHIQEHGILSARIKFLVK